ncbi:hypothetical protein PS838_06151 [Pseudomonas fluorescens]|nr:hypothetical protein PS838_06151 [Pseudomonas fluorescens]
MGLHMQISFWGYVWEESRKVDRYREQARLLQGVRGAGTAACRMWGMVDVDVLFLF